MFVWIIFIIASFSLIFIDLNRGLMKSGISLAVNIINCIISFLITRAIVNSLAVKIGKAFIVTVEEKYRTDLVEFSAINDFLRFAMSIVIGVIAFYIIYFLISIITAILKNFIFYHKTEDVKLNLNPTVEKLLIALTSLVSVTITFVVLVTPFGIIFNNAMKVIPNFKNYKMPFVSEAYFNKLTEMPDNEENIEATKEIDYTIKTAVSVVNLTNDVGSKKANTKEFKENFEKSHFMPTVIGEAGSNAAKHWKNGESYFESKIDIPEGREGKLVIRFLDVLEKWNKNVVVEDVSTLIDIYMILDDYGLEEIQEENGLLKALADEKFSEELFVSLYSNNDFANLVPAVVEYGLGMAFDYVDIELDEEYVSNVDVSKLSEEDMRREARIISGVIRTILEIQEVNEKIDNNQMTDKDIQRIVIELSKLKDSKVLGDIANEFIYQLNASLTNVSF